jgi:osmotically inducible lipoprotein OsmB
LIRKLDRHLAAAQSPSKYQFFATIGSHPFRIIHCGKDGTMSTRIGILLVLAGLLLSACGTNPGDRAGSGALIGAAGGAAIGAMVGAPLQGAAIGAGAGALTGAATSPNTIYLGKPAWEQ